jgi:hypothetical protein
MQMYGQDVIASLQAEPTPYDFSHNPDSPAEATNIPPASDFFWSAAQPSRAVPSPHWHRRYYQLGNTAFIGYSGAHTYEETLPYLEESCTWAQSVNPASIVLLGHWNNEGYGCEDLMTVPNLYTELKSVPACQPLVSKMKYFMGHQHCNHIVEQDVGYMVCPSPLRSMTASLNTHRSVAKAWATSSAVETLAFLFLTPPVRLCFPLWLSVSVSLSRPSITHSPTGGRFKVYFFPIQAHRGYTYYQDTVKCFRDNGVSGCYHLAQVWADLSLEEM